MIQLKGRQAGSLKCVVPADMSERQMFEAVCAACGKTCKVPFQPREDRPVYCSDCFARMKQN